jgi:uroporphyrinogen decarboxylase
MGQADAKIARLRAALSHREADRVPVGEAFWTGFLLRCKEKWGADFDPYRYFDLDYIIITPNMDPHIKPFEIISQKGEDIVIKTGFEAVIRRSGALPMPHFESFSINRPEEMETFQFDDPADPRRFYQAGDDQINGVGDALARNIPAWDERVNAYVEDFAVLGSVCEPYEFLWRIIGSDKALLWLGSETEALQAFVDRIGDFLYRFAEAQIKAAQGRLVGMYIWGDVAYRNGMFFSPALWRRIFKPHVKALIDLFHRHGLFVIYHGCGDARKIFDDFVEMGLDAYNPLEAKANLDVVELKKQYAGKLAFVGNIDVRVLEQGDPEAIRREVLYKLQAAKGGGWVFQSDHSVTSAVAPESYALAIRLLREHGNYPLKV